MKDSAPRLRPLRRRSSAYPPMRSARRPVGVLPRIARHPRIGLSPSEESYRTPGPN